MKYLLPTKIIFFLLCSYGLASGAEAFCGSGKIVRILEGGWNTNDFMIKIDYASGTSQYPGTEYFGFIVYKSTLDSQRLRGIRALALAAYLSGKQVVPYTHTGSCSNATELSFKE
ncbi:MAG: hypothetical protein ACK5TK_07495 [Betaproteobacteria bacterium]